MSYTFYKTRKYFLLLFFVLLLGAEKNYAQTITTFAGSASTTFSGDGGPATAAGINQAGFGIARDGAGNIYVGDLYSYRIRKINTAGIISTYVGAGSAGFSGDGGPATSAQIDRVFPMAADAMGNLYFAVLGSGAYRVRKVDTSGIVTTVVGTGAAGFSGDGGAATAAQIRIVHGLAVDTSGNLYIADNGNNRIRKVITATGIISTVAGTGTAGFSGDGGAATTAQITLYAITVDAAGNIYFSDYAGTRIRKINTSGIINTIAGTGSLGFSGDGGPATAATFNNITGLVVDGLGNIFVSDLLNRRVRIIDIAGTVYTFAGNGTFGFGGDGGPATAARLRDPFGLVLDGISSLYIPDLQNNRVRVVHGRNATPYFTAGASAGLNVCQNSPGDSVNVQLSVMDSNGLQSLTWSLLSGPAHGSATITYAALTTGSIITPRSCSYKPLTGYTGPDTFRVRVTDGFGYDTISIYVTVNPLPATITGVTLFSTAGYSILGSATSGGVWSSNSAAVAAAGSATGIATGVSAGAAIITYTLPTGCYRTTTVNVFPYAGRTISTVAGRGTSNNDKNTCKLSICRCFCFQK